MTTSSKSLLLTSSVTAVKARSAMFTDNSGVSRILTVFFILMCDSLSVLLTLGISAISTTFVTLFLFLVVSNTVSVVLLLDF